MTIVDCLPMIPCLTMESVFRNEDLTWFSASLFMKEIIPVCVTHASNKTPGFKTRDKNIISFSSRSFKKFLLNIHEALLTLAYFLFAWASLLYIRYIPLEMFVFRCRAWIFIKFFFPSFLLQTWRHAEPEPIENSCKWWLIILMITQRASQVEENEVKLSQCVEQLIKYPLFSILKLRRRKRRTHFPWNWLLQISFLSKHCTRKPVFALGYICSIQKKVFDVLHRDYLSWD